MNGTNVIGSGDLGDPGPTWHAIGTGDFNGDGRSDILFQNDSGEIVIWEMNGTSVIGTVSLGNPGPSWHAVGTGDYNGDGHSDIRFQNSSGEVVVWELNGTNVIASGSVGNPGPSWHVATAAPISRRMRTRLGRPTAPPSNWRTTAARPRSGS
jgi:putative lipase involved disintegration of autophagic bodies